MNKTELLDLLKNHVNDIVFLGESPRNYALAEKLYQRTKMIAEKYFKGQYYKIDLLNISFRPSIEGSWTSQGEYIRAWDSAVQKIYSISVAMYDDLKLTPDIKISDSEIKKISEKYTELEDKYSALSQREFDRNEKVKKQKKVLIFLFLFFLLSTFLWTFHFYIKWNWFLNHPRKIAIYISFQLLILFTLLRIINKNKFIKVADWIIALVVALVSLI